MVCVQCSCVLNTGKEVLHCVLTISAEREAASLKVKAPLYNCLLIVCLPSEIKTH